MAATLDALKLPRRTDPKGAVKEAARQFETLFMQELMKSMRAATPDSGPARQRDARSWAPRCSTSSTPGQLSGLPGGLSDAIERQLARWACSRLRFRARAANPGRRQAVRHSRCPTWRARTCRRHAARAFCSSTRSRQEAAGGHRHSGRLHAGAGRARNRLGPRRDPHADGQRGPQPVRHQGHRRLDRQAVAEVTTTEYINGQPRKVMAKFRAYDSMPSRSPTTRS
jgi:flagellar protein FlgJ